MVELEQEMQNVLHPKPRRVGSIGRQELDELIATAESLIDSAIEEINRTEPQGPYASHKTEAIELMRLLISKRIAEVNQLITAVDQSVEMTRQFGENEFRRCNSRPQNTTEEQIDRAWDSFKTVLDSLNGHTITFRIQQELETVSRIDGNDDLMKYLLRDGERLVTRYLESRRQSFDPYFEACRSTSQNSEPDFENSCATLLLARRLERAWPQIRLKLTLLRDRLPGLMQQRALSWDQPARGLSVQSENDGTVRATFASIEEFRAFCRKRPF